MALGERASVGVALMARNASGTLGACLDSIRPYVTQIVVGVDDLTTDDTEIVARQHGADITFELHVSDDHTCPAHGTVKAQHFARARDETFQYLDPSLDWWLWIDTDDVVDHAEHLADLLAGVPPEAIGVWLPYWYSTVENGTRPSTVFSRERLLRPSVGWDWEYRVHEVVKPRQPGPWVNTDAVVVRHQENQHKTESSAARNLLLLEIDLEDDPENSRSIFYLANQYFALNDWANAAAGYEKLLTIGTNVYERWQSCIYASMAYERLGQLDLSEQLAFAALRERAEHPEPYFRLAAVNLLAGKYDQVPHWTKIGRGMERPPFFVFTNPLDYTYNSRLTLADALGNQGFVGAAKAELEAAYRVVPSAHVEAAIGRYAALESAADRADHFKLASEAVDDDAFTVSRYEQLPPEVKQFGRVRDLAVPAILRQRPNTQPRIVFYCGRGVEEWYPGSLNAGGLGGSETAVIEIAKRFSADGWRVDVYNGAGRYEGVYDGVGYFEPERFRQTDKWETPDVFVSWRNPKYQPFPTGNQNILWCHDLNYGPIEGNVTMSDWDAVLGVSEWHAKYLSRAYDIDADYVPNGIDLARFAESVPKKPQQCVYTSSADRGLLHLLGLWPRICADEPDAELVIAYGWDTIDGMIARGRTDLAAFKARVEAKLAETPQVRWVGRLPQDELARLFQQSYLWLYPTSFLETSCITAMEAMAGGCVPVTSRVGALADTIGNGGITVDGMPWGPAWDDFYVHSASGALLAPEVRTVYKARGLERAKDLTWDKSYERWKGIVEGLLK